MTLSSLSSSELFARAQRVLPGGVNSPVRAFKSVGGEPRFMARGEGARIWDREGRHYLDYIGSWGPMILGHGHPAIVEAVTRQAQIGMSFGAATELEVEMAELVTRLVPSMEMLRMVNSGTEATMSAIRVARAFTGRDLVMKFEGCYHGHGDAFLSKAGSGAATFGVPTSPGVPKGAAACTLNATFNDIASVEELFAAHPGAIAAVIVEPVVGNMGCVAPRDGFLQKLRDACTRHGALLILDEVMTGFRLGIGGAQALYNVKSDLTTLGKVIGGGLPVGAYGGRRDIMQNVSPVGPVYQAGTLSGNPLAMSAGLAQLRHLEAHPEVYAGLERKGALLEQAVGKFIASSGLPLSFQRVGSMATLYFSSEDVKGWPEAKTCDAARYGLYFHALLEKGIYMPPAQWEAFFWSDAHTDADIEYTAKCICDAASKA